MMKRVIALAGLLLALFRISASAEEPVWCLMTDSGIAIAMSQVTCLVAADDETTFGIVLQDGTVLAGVRRATFDQTIPTGIEPAYTSFRSTTRRSKSESNEECTIHRASPLCNAQAAYVPTN